jgi:L-lactate dehydrogenase complex protein LldG
MKESKARSRVLREVRNALIHQNPDVYVNLDLDQPIYNAIEESLDVNFAQELSKLGGKFVFCENTNEFLDSLMLLVNENKWENIFCADGHIGKILSSINFKFEKDEAGFLEQNIGITTCEFLISRTGSIVVSSRQAGGRRSFIYPPIHIVVAYSNQLVAEIKDALKGMQKKYSKLPSLITTITGPSRTSDIEKTLVMGAHGPKELYVFLIDKCFE